MNQDLSDHEIARILRGKAEKYIRMAEMLEGAGMDLNQLVSSVRAPLPQPRNVTAAVVKEIIKTGNFRVNGLAQALEVSPSIIRAIIDDPASGLTDQDRGWIREK